jgi:hypothetical protein
LTLLATWDQETDLGVDVEGDNAATRHPGDDAEGVAAEVVLGNGAREARARADLLSFSLEVVGSLLFGGGTSGELDVSTVVKGGHGVAEALGNVDVQVELAVLAVLGDWDTGAGRSNERVKDERKGLTVVGERAAYGALGAARTAIGHGGQVDLARIDTFGGSKSEAGKSEDGSELHDIVRLLKTWA